ncbi:MAG TPA: CBS domain-containing protein [Candidatus Krumholzibacteria bacterium]|nr:CBS domain-containing protein [Candidatus Krumholzibacteria bacterium]
MITVRDILDRKGRQVWSVAPTHTVYAALQMMAEKRIGSLLVLEHDRLVGIVSERDYARKIALAGKASRETAVRDIMTSEVFCVAPSHGIEECMALMTARSVRHLPVMSGDHIEGVVSIGDVVKATIDHQEFIIEQLEHFIAGR